MFLNIEAGLIFLWTTQGIWDGSFSDGYTFTWEWKRKKKQTYVKIVSSLYLSTGIPPFFCRVSFNVHDHFSTPSYHLFWSRTPCILQQPKSCFRGSTFLGFNEFPSFGALSSIIIGHRGLLFFWRLSWDCTCVQCDVCTYSGPVASIGTQVQLTTHRPLLLTPFFKGHFNSPKLERKMSKFQTKSRDQDWLQFLVPDW